MDIVLDFADRIIVLDYGRVLEQGTPADIRDFARSCASAISASTRSAADRRACTMSRRPAAVDDIHTYLGDSHIIQGVSLAVPAGKVVALLGRNGAGKTTTLRSIMRMARPRRGRVTFDGSDISALATFEIARARIAFVQETRAIFPSLTVGGKSGDRRTSSRQRAAGPSNAFSTTFPSSQRDAATAARNCRAASSKCSLWRARWWRTRA